MRDQSPPSDQSLQLAAWRLYLDTQAVRLVQSLEAAGIASVLLKGPALAQWLYGPAEMRSYVDIDLLVSPGDVDAALAVLYEAGYRDELGSDIERSHHGRHLRATAQRQESDENPPLSAPIDLHVSFQGVEGPESEFWRAISEEAEVMRLQHGALRIPSPRARALLVALHAAGSGPSLSKPLEDLDRALTQVPDDLWRASYRLACEQQATAFFLAGLAMRPAGEALITRCGFTGSKSASATLRVRGMPPVAEGVERLASAPWREKAEILGRELVPTPGFMRVTSRLARRGMGGLLLAYLVRPFWLIAKLPRALGAIRSARKEAAANPPEPPQS